MNYEFHVGDYVEARNGDVGYITDINLTYPVADFPYFDWITKEGKSSRQRIDALAEKFGFVLADTFNRIGAYDFTKKEKKRIARLSEYDGWLTFRNTNKANVNLCYIVKRINELVDAVNLLLDKSTES